jgi:hypothetical protein
VEAAVAGASPVMVGAGLQARPSANSTPALS